MSDGYVPGAGTLFVVATPIGNRADISGRAVDVLRSVALVAAEDTRRAQSLLQHLGIRKPLLSLHQHNESARIPGVLARLAGGDDVALIADAGTPLISDPGFRLVNAVHAQALRVSPIPGPSAVLAALSVAGLPTDRFVFEGFAPAKPAARRRWFGARAAQDATLVLLEASHRIVPCLQDAAAVFGARRPAAVTRELTKRFETVMRGALADMAERIAADPDQQKGEFVILVGGSRQPAPSRPVDADRLLRELLDVVGPSKAAQIVARCTGQDRKALYRTALSWRAS